LWAYEAGKTSFEFAHFVMPDWGVGESPNWRLADYEGEPIVLGLRSRAARSLARRPDRLLACNW
jgi:hypothetical protein